MLINHDEYKAMYEVEENLWWYRILHLKTLNAIQKNFGKNPDIKILDAGCGTGGMMKYLIENGFKNVEGFDFNQSAVDFSLSRQLKVSQKDITKLENSFPSNTFDVIISNDVLYQFETFEIERIFKNINEYLKPGGIFISNNNAFQVFSGTHDIAVGSKRRFVLSDFHDYIKNISTLVILKYHYWSFLLSPLILVVRTLQRIQLKMGKIDLSTIKSDVSLPGNFVNAIFYSLLKFESNYLPKFPFGSSLFIIFKKEK